MQTFQSLPKKIDLVRYELEETVVRYSYTSISSAVSSAFLLSSTRYATPVLIKVTSVSQCKVSLWRLPYVCLCPCTLKCPTARLGPDPISCLHPQSGDSVPPLIPEELIAQPDSGQAHTHQMERNMLTHMICWTSKREPGKERERR